MRLEDVFKEKFNKEVEKHSKAISFKAFKQESVKNITELILLFAALVLYLVNSYFLNYNYLTLIASLSFIGYRLIPVLNRSINSIQSLNHGKSALNIIINTVKSSNILIRQNKTTEVDGNVKEMQLIFKNFTLYNGHVLFPFKQILIKRGELFVIHGRSGSGKSTILSSLIHGKGEELSIQICGQNFKGLKFLNNFKIGSLSQLPFVFKSTVKENITVYSNQAELYSLDLKDFSFCLDTNEDSALSFDKIESDIRISEDVLSGGQKQRIGLMRAIYFGKDILILDEPTSALDSENKRKFIDFIEEKLKNHFIIMVSHDDEIIKLSDKQLNLNNNEK
jgi:ABC-type bacteriocin/lantibiotic exporter with double-glycine peptidase domain